jgi:hypothetical protein
VVKNFKRGDLGKIEPSKPTTIDRDSHYYEGMEQLGRTMFEVGSEVPIAAWGMQPHWEGVASVWSEFSPLSLTKYHVSVAKNVKRHLNEHIELLGLHRVQSLIQCDDDISIHWIKWLGFHAEGLMEQYMKGVDVFMYARIIR